MKERIIKFFTSDRSYKGAVALYNELGNRLSLKKQLNLQPESPYLKGVVFEELRILGNIQPKDYDAMMLQSVKKDKAPEAIPSPPDPPAPRMVQEKKDKPQEKSGKSGSKKAGRSKK